MPETPPPGKERWTTPPADGGLWFVLLALGLLAGVITPCFPYVGASPFLSATLAAAVLTGTAAFSLLRPAKPTLARLVLALTGLVGIAGAILIYTRYTPPTD